MSFAQRARDIRDRADSGLTLRDSPRASGGRRSSSGGGRNGGGSRRPSSSGGKGGGGGKRRRRSTGAKLAWRIGSIVVLAGTALAAAGVGVLAVMFYYYGRELPKFRSLRDYAPPQVTRVLAKNGELLGELYTERRTVVPYKDIPKSLINAVTSAEDAEFFKHGGLSYLGMLRAVYKDVRGRGARQGASTITQQVVRTFLLSREKKISRKIAEVILARRIEEHFSKEEILWLYLNQINFGHGRYGVEEAARFYFGKPVRELQLIESALLAGLPQSPGRLSPFKNPEGAKKRRAYVLSRMEVNGHIPPGEAIKLARAPLGVREDPRAQPGVQAPEVVDEVRRRLVERLGEQALGSLGWTLHTTVDATLQGQARASIERGLEGFDRRYGLGKSRKLRKGEEKLVRKSWEAEKKRPVVEGLITRVDDEKEELWVDLGEKSGLVSLREQQRYARGESPPSSRFKPGEAVRVSIRGSLDAPAAAPGDDEAAAAPPPPPKPKPRPVVEEPAATNGKKAKKAKGKGKKAAPVEEPEPPQPAAPARPPTVKLQLENGPQAAMVVIDPKSRDLLAMVGGYDFKNGYYNRALSAHRLPGSAFKPIVFAAAVAQKAITPATVINDAPETYGKWKPENYDGKFRGPVRAREAVAHSINLVAIKVLEMVGIDQVRRLARAMGIVSTIPEGLSVALGTAAVTPIELTNAFATFPAQGRYAPWRLISKIDTGGRHDDEARVLAPRDSGVVEVLRPEVAFLMTSMLRSVVEEGTAKRARVLGRPTGGKTGSAILPRKPGKPKATGDVWYVGFSPDLVVGTWIGYDDMHDLGAKETGGRSALPIYIDFMRAALTGRPARPFPQPSGVVVARIDPASGKLMPPGQLGGLEEVFLEGTAPTEVATEPGQRTPDTLLMDDDAAPGPTPPPAPVPGSPTAPQPSASPP